MKINWFKILIYVSLVFLVVYLIKSDLLIIPSQISLPFIIISLIFLFSGFITLGVRWYFILHATHQQVKVSDAIVSCGLSIFAKYIPGKVLMIIGKVGFIKNKYPYDTSKLIVTSLNDQLLALWTGLLFGSFCLIGIQQTVIFYITIALWVIISITIFTPKVYQSISFIIYKILKKPLTIEIIPFRKILALMPIYLLYWILIGLGFYFLAKGIKIEFPPISAIFAFPLSVVVGIISIISPGGLGVREAILGSVFIGTLESSTAITLASISRLWFLVGEVFIFAIGNLLNLSQRIRKS